MKIKTNFKKSIYSCLLLGSLFVASSSSFAQTDKETKKEAKKEQRLFKKAQLPYYLSQPYFYAGFGLGGSIFIPTSTSSIVSGDKTAEPWIRNLNRVSSLFQGQLFLGFQIKRHYASIRFENLTFSYGNEFRNGTSTSSSEHFTIIPYTSLSYQYDVLNNNKKVSLQPGVHLGMGFFDVKSRDYESSQYGINYKEVSTGASKVAFAFGPSLNFEVNINRWFSFNIYQQLTYMPGSIMNTNYFYQLPGQSPIEQVNKTRFLNYSANFSLRFKMYMKGTKQRVNDLMK